MLGPQKDSNLGHMLPYQALGYFLSAHLHHADNLQEAHAGGLLSHLEKRQLDISTRGFFYVRYSKPSALLLGGKWVLHIHRRTQCTCLVVNLLLTIFQTLFLMVVDQIKKKLSYMHNESTTILREIAQKEKLSLKKKCLLKLFSGCHF